ncbi:MAG: BrnA antitoxin family protein [Mariprofundales bacterium]|nr:BrnA antitoxin family protein [Mariprofundales bacterium]
MSTKTKLMMPTTEEDAAINAAIAADPDTFELTAEDFKRMRSARDQQPEIVAAYERGDFNAPPQIHASKQRITIRLDRDIIDHFKAIAGSGSYQRTINQALRHTIGREQLAHDIEAIVRKTIREEISTLIH